MNYFILSAIVVLTLPNLQQVDAKKFMRCELAKLLLQRYRFNRSFLSHWVCLIEHESDRDTSVVKRLPNGSASFGLFQINSKEWCREGRVGGICNAKCEDFITDDISRAVTCAQKIFDRDGFKHWEGWRKYCRNAHVTLNLRTLCGF